VNANTTYRPAMAELARAVADASRRIVTVSLKRRSPPWSLLAIVSLSLAGAWISGQLVKQHAGLWDSRTGAHGLFGRVCQASSKIGLGGCDGSVKSRWAEIPLPIPVPTSDLTIHLHTVPVPVAFLGLSYFVFLGVWFALIGLPRAYGRRWHRVPLAVALFGAAVSVLYLTVMALGLAPPCPWCLVVHVMNLVIARVVWRLCKGRTAPGKPTSADGMSPAEAAAKTLTSREAASAIACSLVVIAGLWAYRSERLALAEKWGKLARYKAMVTSLREDPQFLLREHQAQPKHDIPLRPTESAPSGRPQVVVFTDFQCPSCYCASRQLHDVAARTFGGNASVLVRHYPLCNACNEHVKGQRHQAACQAAYAAEAARILGGEKAFWQMHNLLFENRKQLGESTYRALAEKIGLDPNLLLKEMHSDAVRGIVAADIKLARRAGVSGTPTVFVNGRRLTAVLQTKRFWQSLANAHSHRSKKGTPMAAASRGSAVPSESVLPSGQ